MPLSWLFKRWFWSGVGIFMLFLGLAIYGDLRKFLPASEVATGTVLEIQSKTVETSGRLKTYYKVTVEYQTPEGQTHLAEIGDIDEGEFPATGGQLEFNYDPNNPSDARHFNFYEKWLEWGLLILIGTVIIILALWPGLAKLFRLFKSFGKVRAKQETIVSNTPSDTKETPTIRRR